MGQKTTECVPCEKSAKVILPKIDPSVVNESTSDNLVIFHKTLHTPVHLNQKQSNCLGLLASGKSSKEIATIILDSAVKPYCERLIV